MAHSRGRPECFAPQMFPVRKLIGFYSETKTFHTTLDELNARGDQEQDVVAVTCEYFQASTIWLIKGVSGLDGKFYIA